MVRAFLPMAIAEPRFQRTPPFLAGLMITALSLVTCSDFPTRYERIENNRVSVLDFVYCNLADTTLAEGAPGDSMKLTAYFSGEQVKNIKWSVSFDVARDVAGNAVPLRVQPLNYV
ncbi:MAG: hypothetical protein GF344_19040, partial [Chitinivibrionales bacterium]|nr:hypothetical protein [Chitinivibrionales bacterium]MBD3358723.1 hypothetical protein [Chitinivibrionales bacterium]